MAERLITVGEEEGLLKPHVVSISGGGVQLEWYTPEHGFEFVIHADGGLEDLLVERPEDVMAEGKLSSVDVPQVREHMRRFIRAS